MKSFITLTKEECGIYYKHIYDNANAKWNAGNLLAEKNDYASAINSKIISIEELIKTLIILADSKGFNFTKVKGIERFFKNHQIRHFLAFIIFGVSVFSDDLLIFLRWFNIYLRKNPIRFTLFLDKNMIEENEVRSIKISPELKEKAKKYIVKKFDLIAQEFEWFSKMDILSQDSLYTDFSGSIKSPLTISKSEYLEVNFRLEKVKKIADYIIKAYEEEHESEELKKVSQEIKTKVYYKDMEKSLTQLKGNRNVFDLTKEYFNIDVPNDFFN